MDDDGDGTKQDTMIMMQRAKFSGAAMHTEWYLLGCISKSLAPDSSDQKRVFSVLPAKEVQGYSRDEKHFFGGTKRAQTATVR